MTDNTRIVVQFSCGAASAVAAKLQLCGHSRSRVVIVNAFVAEEHSDNRRFFADCEKWLGCSITVLRDERYGASTDEVWRRKRYIKGPNGAPCSAALKRSVLNEWSRPDDIWVIGYTAEEEDRADNLRDLYPDREIWFPLIERGLSKSDCLAIIERAGIQIPEMYRLGFDNANCIGCPKGGQNYWQAIRHHFPERFAAVQQIQDSIGPSAYFLQFRSGPRKGERMALSDLPNGCGNMRSEPSFDCSFFCALAEDRISESLIRLGMEE